MTQIYKHTQIGAVILALLGSAILLSAVSIFTIGSHPILIAVLIVLLACAILFPSMTVEIGNGLLTWRFGLGIIHKIVRVTEVESAEAVRNHWLYGWGIHLTPHGWLYNVSGLSAVQVRLKSGKRFRLGTDEPEELVRAIASAKAFRST